MQRLGMMSKIIAVVTGVTLAIAALATAFAQPGGPPHAFYGTGATPGDVIVAQISHGDHYDSVGEATVDADGSWYINVSGVDLDEIEWTVNGEHADAAITSEGESQSSVVLTIHMEDDSMMEEGDDSMMEEGDGEDSMMEEGEDSMMEEGDDDAMLDEEGESLYPDTGTGGLADTSGGVSAGLIGLLIAIGAVAVTGLSLRRVRNRA